MAAATLASAAYQAGRVFGALLVIAVVIAIPVLVWRSVRARRGA